MGDLFDYYIVLSEVKYNDDPMCFGRVRCDIPGVIHSSNIDSDALPDAMPWVRPFKMYGYQTFSKAMVGQKIWVLISKTNYNEFWWFPYYETIDFVQQYISENYDNQPDVIHARQGSAGNTIFSYDEEHGYMMRVGEDYLNLMTNNSMKIAFGECRVMINGGKQYCGAGDDVGGYEPCVMGNKCKDLRKNLSLGFKKLKSLAQSSPYTQHLASEFDNLSSQITADILGTNHYVN
jgi:hypothetical protein